MGLPAKTSISTVFVCVNALYPTQNCVIVQEKAFTRTDNSNETPGLQNITGTGCGDRERGFERAAQKLCITQSAVSSALSNWKICSGSRCWCVPYPAPDGTRAKTAGTAAPGGVAEEEWLGDEQTGSTPLLLSLASTPTVWRRGCFRHWLLCWLIAYPPQLAGRR